MLTRTSPEVRQAVDQTTDSACLCLETLVNSIDGIVWEADPRTFRFTFVSEQARRILGYAPEDWLEEGFWEAHLHPDDVGLAIEHCTGWNAQSPRRCHEYRMVARDGRAVWLRDLISIEMRDGRPAGLRGIMVDISEHRRLDKEEARREIERLSLYDGMTGLPNRAFLHDRLAHALKAAERDHSHVALLAVDLDRLAHINEVLGHQIGDRLLVAVAERLRGAMRGADTVTRHVGDEFVIIMEDLANPRDAAVLAERVLDELSRPFALEGHEVNISACIGIGIYPEDGTTPLVLIKHADVALHHAKEAGERNYQFFCEEMNRSSTERLQIESNLRLALQRGEFHLVYQPQVELETGRITGMEALVRWTHPELGMVSPARFIPIAEESGHIIEIGLWVLREACRQTRRWHEQGFEGLQVAVNVSARQFRQDDFARQVRAVLEETGLAPECLELELTESMIMQRPERVVAVMGELRALGVTFSIDDFGTGYSSLSQLKRFPLDKLKIDQSFTHDIGTDAGTAITCAIIALANSLRLRVVAEGVETTEQKRFLIDNGCHSMQGYLFSRPVAASEFHALLLMHRVPLAV